MTISTNEIGALTVQHIIPEVPDALMKENAFLNYLFTDGKYKVTGGTNLQFPIKLIANSSSGSISGTGGTINVNPSQQLVYGTLNWKYYYWTVNFTLDDYNRTFNSKEAVLSFMETKKEGALSDYVRTQSSDVLGTSTSNALNYEGVQDAAAATGTTYGGLLDTDYTSGAYLPVTSTASIVNYQSTNAMIQNMKARAQQFGEAGNDYFKDLMGIWNQATATAFLNACQDQQRFYEAKELDSGFEGIKVNTVKFYADANVAGSQDGSTGDNQIYIFPKKIFKFAYKYGLNSPSPLDGETKIPNQPIISHQSYTSGNLICVNRRLLAVGKSFVA